MATEAGLGLLRRDSSGRRYFRTEENRLESFASPGGVVGRERLPCPVPIPVPVVCGGAGGGRGSL